MAGTSIPTEAGLLRRHLMLSRSASRLQRLGALAARGALLLVTCSSVFAVIFIFLFIFRDALPFFGLRGFAEVFTDTAWYPSAEPASFGALAIFFGSGIVTLGAVVVAVPLGVAAAVCLSDVLPFSVRQFAKPVIEMLAAIPSVAYGFFALVVLAPLLQEKGGVVLSVGACLAGAPLGLLAVVVLSDLLTSRLPDPSRPVVRLVLMGGLCAAGFYGLTQLVQLLLRLPIHSGTNALNVSVILGIMALPTVVSVSEDALHAVGRELREASYALGATRAETLVKVVIPAARSGILAAVVLGVMRAVGETMVVWMASGNAAQIPRPWFNVLEPIRTLTATIAGEMGEADHVTGSARYHVLFALALCLLLICFVCNLLGEWAVRRSKARLR